LAPVQVVIVPIFRKEEEKSLVMSAVEKVKNELSEFRVKVDDRTEVTPGFKFNHWEMRGVPLRLEIGPKDVAKNSVALARRDILGREGKSFVAQEGIGETVREKLDQIQRNLLEKARIFRDDRIFEPKDFTEFKEVIDNNSWCSVWWKPNAENEALVKEQTRATLRCYPIDQPDGMGKCIFSGEETSQRALFAKAY
jgi:prolyl-tRNA synthetase